MTPLFASPRGFPPSLSKDAQEAAAAAPQHFHPTQSCFPKGSGLEQSGELSILHPLLPAPCLGCFLVFRGAGGYGRILGWLHQLWARGLLWEERRGVFGKVCF